MTEKKKIIWKQCYMIVLYCFFGLVFLGIAFSGNDCNCYKEQKQVEKLENQLQNVERGLIATCEWGKVGSKVSLSYIEFIELMGVYSFSQYKESLEKGANTNCYEILEIWRDK